MTKRGLRLGCISVFTLWVVLAAIIYLFFALLRNGEVVLGTDPLSQTRIFLIQEPGQEGVGVERTRLISEDGECVQTSINYWMFEGEGADAQVCICNGTPTAVPAGCALE